MFVPEMKTGPLAETAIVPPVRLNFPYIKRQMSRSVAVGLHLPRVRRTPVPAIPFVVLWSR